MDDWITTQLSQKTQLYTHYSSTVEITHQKYTLIAYSSYHPITIDEDKAEDNNTNCKNTWAVAAWVEI